MHEVNFDKEKGDRDMKKRKMILSVMLLLSITTGCAAGEAKALSDSKGRMSLSADCEMQQQGKRNFHCGERHREDIRGEQIRSGGGRIL